MKIAAVIIIWIGILGLLISIVSAVRGRLLSRMKALKRQRISIAMKMDEIEIKEDKPVNDGWETATTLIYDATELLNCSYEYYLNLLDENNNLIE